MKTTITTAVVLAGFAGMLAAHPVAGQTVAAQNTNLPEDATTRAVLNRKVSVDVTNMVLRQALQTVAAQTQTTIFYNWRIAPYQRRITLHVTDEPLRVVFEQLLAGTSLHVIVGPHARVFVVDGTDGGDVAAMMALSDSTGVITGRVVDSATGHGIVGATIKVSGTKLNGVTSDSGRFTLKNVPVGDRLLIVRVFGYRPMDRNVTVTDDTPVAMRIALALVPNVLSGVVTTATGQQRRVEVGNDITAINVDSVTKIAPITSVTDLLETRVPGLTVVHSSGIPGAPSRIRLRGVSSITGNNDPIIIVDGIRMYGNQSDARNANLAQSRSGGGDAKKDAGGNLIKGYSAPSPLDQIDPNSIETIEVSKGPSASALYGSDAANGVIVITTKRGRAGPTHWGVVLGQGVNWLPGRWPTNYYRFGKHSYKGSDVSQTRGGSGIIDLDTLSRTCDWNDLACTVDSFVPYQALNDPRYSVFSHGTDQTASLNVSGGVPTLQYSVSGSSAKTVGNLKLPLIEQQRYEHFYGNIPSYLVRPDRYTTWGTAASLTAQPSTNVRVALQSSLFNSNQQQGSLQQAITQLQGQYVNAGLFGFKHVTVISPNSPGGVQVDSASNVANTPLIANDVEKATSALLTSNNSVTLNWQAAPWLPLSITGGLNTIQKTDQTYIPFGVGNGGPGTIANVGNATVDSDTLGSYGLGRGASRNQTLQVNTLIPLFRGHMSLALGGQAYTETTTDFRVATNQLAPGVSVPTQFFQCTDTGEAGVRKRVCLSAPSSQSTGSQSTYGWFFEPKLNFASRFFMAPGFRLDGGSGGTHGSSSGSGGLLGGLTTFPKIDFSYLAVDQSHPRGPVSLWRPRIAFGFAGTQPDPAQKLRLFSSDSLAHLNESLVVPEVALQSIGNTALRPETSRELEGGFDLELWRGRVVTTWTHYTKTRYNAIIPIPIAPSVVGLVPNQQVNIGEVRNTGTEVTGNVQVFESRTMSWFVGGSISNDNNLLVKLAPGFVPNKTVGIVAGYPLFGSWARPIATFVDVNHNGIIESSSEVLIGDSLVYVGQSNPKYQATLNTGLTLFSGRLGVNAGFAYTNGMTQNNQGAITSGAVNFIANAPNTTLATQAAIAAATCVTGDHCATYIGFYQTVNTFRFNTLSINYAVPKTVSRLFRVPAATLALQGSNLALHTNYRGIDPNVNAFSTVSAGDETMDLGQIPEPRTWWLKLNLGN